MNGTLHFQEGHWLVSDLKPHVSMRFKDMFKGVRFGSRPPFVIKDRRDIVADLDWFMARYPLAMSTETKVHFDVSLAGYHDHQRDVEQISSGDYIAPKIDGFRAGYAPEAYQERAADMFRTTGRLLLMDDVGLGKTVSFLASLMGGWGLPAAVVVQPHLSRQWITDYINKFTELTAVEIKKRDPHELPKADIYVWRYSNISGWVDYFEQIGLKTVCFDEIQELRHGRGTDKGRASRYLANACENVIGLTATPIYNYGGEIWNIVEVIDPGALGSWDEFTINWCTTHGNHWIVKDPPALGTYLLERGLVMRRTNEDAEVSQSLPPLYKNVLEVEWNEDDVDTDRDLQKRLAQRILTGDFYSRGQAARELDVLLRQETGIAKARSVAAYVRLLVESGEQVLLAGWHRAVYDIWNAELGDLFPTMFTGTESQAKKRAAKEAFVSGASPILAMSLRSGAGLDGLQHVCRHVVYGEFDWSPQVHTQFTGRIRRRGQQHPVTAHFLHVNGGSDPVIMSTLGLKASQSHGLINPFAELETATPVDTTRMRQLAEKVLEDHE